MIFFSAILLLLIVPTICMENQKITHRKSNLQTITNDSSFGDNIYVKVGSWGKSRGEESDAAIPASWKRMQKEERTTQQNDDCGDCNFNDKECCQCLMVTPCILFLTYAWVVSLISK